MSFSIYFKMQNYFIYLLKSIDSEVVSSPVVLQYNSNVMDILIDVLILAYLKSHYVYFNT